MSSQLHPSAILQTAFSFWSSKVLLTAVEFSVFTKLADRRLTGAELGAELKLHPRAIADFFDALFAMKFLGREGDGPTARYFNTPEGALFFRGLPSHFKDFFNGEFEEPRHLESEGEAWVVLFGFDGVDRLTRDTEFVSQIGLGPLFGRPQFAHAILHW